MNIQERIKDLRIGKDEVTIIASLNNEQVFVLKQHSANAEDDGTIYFITDATLDRILNWNRSLHIKEMILSSVACYRANGDCRKNRIRPLSDSCEDFLDHMKTATYNTSFLDMNLSDPDVIMYLKFNPFEKN